MAKWGRVVYSSGSKNIFDLANHFVSFFIFLAEHQEALQARCVLSKQRTRKQGETHNAALPAKKQRKCTKCGNPMKGHSKSHCITQPTDDQS